MRTATLSSALDFIRLAIRRSLAAPRLLKLAVFREKRAFLIAAEARSRLGLIFPSPD